MHHDATNDPHHVITLKVGDRLRARRMTADLRAGDLYEVLGFRDVPFPNQHHSTVRLLDVTTGRKSAVLNSIMQSGYASGAWGLA